MSRTQVAVTSIEQDGILCWLLSKMLGIERQRGIRSAAIELQPLTK